MEKSEAQYGVKASWIRNIGGAVYMGMKLWFQSGRMNLQRIDIIMGQRGYFLDKGINRSIGTQFSSNYQDLESYFGNRIFNAQEQMYMAI